MTPITVFESGTTVRNRLSRSIVLSIRTLMQQKKPDKSSLDMAAFVVIALEQIEKSVETSVLAWEKRDYWIKADRFRLDWLWVGELRKRLSLNVLKEDWALLAPDLALVAQHLNQVEIRPNNRIGEPWTGAWEVFSKSKTK
ncbi:MAG: hypothetical protein VB108_05565 [Anaerolineaceae bacterium]|nr:hypothetical protein [Anaerolineaceae bacterium]